VRIVEKVLDAVLVLHVVKQHETHVACRDKGRDQKVVETVHLLEVHGLRAPHKLVDHVQRRVDDGQLVEVRRVLALRTVVRSATKQGYAEKAPGAHPLGLCFRELGLVDGCIVRGDDDKEAGAA